MNIASNLAEQLQARAKNHRYRQRRVVESAQRNEFLVDGVARIAFCSNDYLGLANHPSVTEAFVRAAQRYGVGSGASHLVCGHSSEHHALEEELAAFSGRDRALLFSTGYMANMGVINALVTRGDAVFEDKLNHASLIDGGLLTSAELIRYRHNDMAHLQSRLAASTAKNKLVVTDGVFSMDGDIAELPQLAQIATQNNAWLMVDDAHGFGCLGQRGGGSVEHFGLSQRDVPVLIGTLGKAFGSFGAFVAGSHDLIEALIQFARTYIYTTALPPAVAAATRASLKVLQEESWRRTHLQTLIAHFRQGCEAMGLPLMESFSPIQPVLIGSEELALRASNILENAGCWVTAIRPPTVAEGTSRLRVTFSAEHTVQQVDILLDALCDVAALLGESNERG